jgi:hypothetical protein
LIQQKRNAGGTNLARAPNVTVGQAQPFGPPQTLVSLALCSEYGNRAHTDITSFTLAAHNSFAFFVSACEAFATKVRLRAEVSPIWAKPQTLPETLFDLCALSNHEFAAKANEG